MGEKYQVRLWEDKVITNHEGQVIHHPLNGNYRFDDGRDFPSYGYLTFCGHDMDKSSRLGDIHVFHIDFSGESVPDREAWADKIRAQVLKRLCNDNVWYLGVIASDAEKISRILLRNLSNLEEPLDNHRLINTVIVDSEKKYGYGTGFIKRIFFEIPGSVIERVLLDYWPDATPGWPIEGYCMNPNSMDLLVEWNKRPRNDELFRDVLDRVQIAFYTYPAEHRHFAFFTNKLLLKDVADSIQIKALQRKAREIGKNSVK